MNDKTTIILVLLILGVVLLIVYEDYIDAPQPEDYNKKAIEEILEKYQQVKKTKITHELRDRALTIVRNRKNCFSTQITYSERNNTCKK